MTICTDFDKSNKLENLWLSKYGVLPWRRIEWVSYIYTHTYIIGYYNSSEMFFMLCAFILYVSGGAYSLTSTTNDRFFLRKFIMAGLFTLIGFARNLLRGHCRRNIFFFSYFVLMPDLGYEPGLYVSYISYIFLNLPLPCFSFISQVHSSQVDDWFARFRWLKTLFQYLLDIVMSNLTHWTLLFRKTLMYWLIWS